MSNEYKDAFDSLQDENTFKGQQWFGKRQRLVEEYSWAVPNNDVVRYLAEFDELTEVGAGSGYWAYCIEEAGGYVQASDVNPPDETYTAVTAREAGELNLRDSAVLMVWPPNNEPLSSIVASMEPPHILYVGEPAGGCTANEKFFRILEDIYGLVAKVEIPSYAGVHDDLYHYVRKR